MTVFCSIGGTHYGPNIPGWLSGAAGIFAGAEIDATGPDFNGSAKVSLLKQGGGGYSIIDMQEVQIGNKSSSTGLVTERYFGGFVIDPGSSQVMGTTLKTWDVLCTDYNILLDTLVGGVAGTDPPVGTLGIRTFKQAVGDVVAALNSGGPYASLAIDASTEVANLAPSYLFAKGYQGLTLREMLQDLCNTIQALFPAMRPKFFMGLSKSTSSASFGGPVLHVYDAAATTTVSKRFSDNPADVTAGTHFAMTSTYKRRLPWERPQTRGQIIYGAPPYGPNVVTRTDPVSLVQYPNPYDRNGAWGSKPLKEESITDTLTAMAALDLSIAKRSLPRESIPFQTRKYVIPGEYISLTLSNEGLSNAEYRAAAVHMSMSQDTAFEVWYKVTAGNKILLLGERDDNGINARPIIKDVVAPNAPTGVGVVNQIFDQLIGMVRVSVSLTAPAAADRAKYTWKARQGSTGYVMPPVEAINTTTPGGLPPTTAELLLPPGQSTTLTVTCTDWSDNESPEASYTFTTASYTAPGTALLNPTFQLPQGTNTTAALNWTHIVNGFAQSSRQYTKNGSGQFRCALDKGFAMSDQCGVLSDFTPTVPECLHSIQVEAGASTNAPSLTVEIDWYDSSKTLLSTTTVVTGASISAVIPNAVMLVYSATSPVNATFYRIRLLNIYTAGPFGVKLHGVFIHLEQTKRLGMGSVVTQSAVLSMSATSGFLYIPTVAGAPTGTPTAEVGTVPVVFDTTNDVLRVYDSSWLTYGSQPSVIPRTRIYNTASQVITHSTETALTFNTERWDDTNMWVVGNPTRVTIVTPGTYDIFGHAEVNSTNNVGRRSLGIKLTRGATVIRPAYSTMPAVVEFLPLTVGTEYKLLAGDIVELVFFHTAGAGVTQTISAGSATAAYACDLSVSWKSN
ncbi:MAG TPA: hypothetical protein VF914_21050 [Chloroflexia bacterium]|jgi:hypothetical protein